MEILGSLLGYINLEIIYVVKDNLELFLNNLKSGKQVPFRIGRSTPGVILNYFSIGMDREKKPYYNNDKSKNVSIDQNSLLVISSFEYYIKTKDKKFLENNIYKLKRVLDWNFTQDKDKDNLIEENYYANWADSVKKRGKVLYSNVCHAHAIHCFSRMMHVFDKKLSKEYHDKFLDIKKKINTLFWSGEHYIDWIDDEKQYNYFSTDGNTLAILWDIADPEKSKHIEEASHIFDLHDVPSGCVHPKLPKNLVSPLIKSIGLGDYHNGLSWLWLGAINAAAKFKIGKKQDAADLIKKMSRLIVKHDGVFEVYENNGNPVKRIIYHSEQPFAWSSGLFLYAVDNTIGLELFR